MISEGVAEFQFPSVSQATPKSGKTFSDCKNTVKNVKNIDLAHNLLDEILFRVYLSASNVSLQLEYLLKKLIREKFNVMGVYNLIHI